MGDERNSQEKMQLLLELVLELLRRPSPSGFEEGVCTYITNTLLAQQFHVSVDEMGNLLAVRGKPLPGEGYPLLSFHMDTFAEPGWEANIAGLPPAPLPRKGESQADKLLRQWIQAHCDALQMLPTTSIEQKHGRLHTNGTRILGGDDKCGAALALLLAKQTSIPMKIIASVQEELDCLGINQVDPTFFSDVSYALVLDRQGNHDLVTSIRGQPICTEPFAQTMLVVAKAVGLPAQKVDGRLSDALALSHYIADVVNLSVGYYEPHSPQEYIVMADVLQAYRWVKRALDRLPRPCVPDLSLRS
jgi:putative aminopeptidase FrvX